MNYEQNVNEGRWGICRVSQVTKKLKNAKKMSKCNKTGVCSGGQAGPGCHRAQRLLTNAR